jgi:hypothetical protein
MERRATPVGLGHLPNGSNRRFQRQRTSAHTPSRQFRLTDFAAFADAVERKRVYLAGGSPLMPLVVSIVACLLIAVFVWSSIMILGDRFRRF